MLFSQLTEFGTVFNIWLDFFGVLLLLQGLTISLLHGVTVCRQMKSN
jgi:hypothetical protein